jgi:calcineurin-like phosphoesterase family protein
MHFFHENILKFGQRDEFKNLDEMHSHMIREWNKVVGKKDLVYIVGDFSFGGYEESKSMLNRLNGKKILIMGNHDRKSKRHISRKEFMDMGFTEVMDEDVIKLSNGMHVYLKHYPYREGYWANLWRKLTNKKYRGGQERVYMQFYPAWTKMWHIHGHHHGGEIVHGNQINVSSETLKYRPISESEVIKLIEKNS